MNANRNVCNYMQVQMFALGGNQRCLSPPWGRKTKDGPDSYWPNYPNAVPNCGEPNRNVL